MIALLPVGVDVSYGSGEFALRARAGAINIDILPRGEKKQGKEKKKQPKKDAGPKKTGRKKMPAPREILALIRLGLHALGRFGRKLSVDLFVLRYTAASNDPYSTAVQFGGASAAIGALLPELERHLKIRRCDVRADFDFESSSPEIFVQITATIQIWEIVYIGAAFGVEFLVWRSAEKKRIKQTERNGSHGKKSDQ